MNVLLVIDVKGWAWYLKSKEIKKYLSDKYDISIKVQKEFSNKDFETFDAIHSFGWMVAGNHKKMTSAISSHNYELLHKESARKSLPGFAGISCVSKELFIKAKSQNLNKNLYLCCNGVDENKFYPKEKRDDSKFVVGWVGQKTQGSLSKKPIDIKGYQHILLPLKEKLEQHKDIKLIVHSNGHTNAIPHEEMPKLYHQMDLLISTSFLEGTPGSVFEAAASGLPVISTAVGCVPELITNSSNGILLKPYKNDNEAKSKVNEFLDKILFLKNNRELCKIMGDKNRKEIESNWTWKQRAKQWIPVFENHRIK